MILENVSRSSGVSSRSLVIFCSLSASLNFFSDHFDWSSFLRRSSTSYLIARLDSAESVFHLSPTFARIMSIFFWYDGSAMISSQSASERG